ncbi:MAG TPA: HD domain-containing phosphohydrolase [Anaerolineales bacterium]|nr:HD domain-containing phosphohydrolase [Anaerolineales bacterium]
MTKKKILPVPFEIERMLQKMERLMEINITLNSTLELAQVLDLIIAKAVEMLECEAGSILLYSKEKDCLYFSASTSADPKTLAAIPVPLSDSLAGAIFSKNSPVVVNNVEQDIRHNASVAAQINFRTSSLLGVPMRIQDRVTGVLEALNKKQGTFTEEDVKILTAIASQAAVAIENAQLVQALQESYESTLEGWAAALDLRDKETEGHSQRVTWLALQLAQEVGMGKEALGYLRQGALLHDIGKMAVPDRILHKNGPLTDQEKAVMRQHPVNAYNMLYPIAYLRSALDIPYCHHEKWDGSGYPRGLKGEEIPLAARIFTIIDVWDALRSNRPYRKAWPVKKTIAYIQKQAGIAFDPQIVKSFVDAIPSILEKNELLSKPGKAKSMPQ